MYNKWKKSSLF